jgi:hypothetical protein
MVSTAIEVGLKTPSNRPKRYAFNGFTALKFQGRKCVYSIFEGDSMDRKIGVVSVVTRRGFSILRVGPESSLERYFLHISKIRSGTATPAIGMTVVFDVSDKPVPEGQLPQAIRADIIVDPEPAVEEPAAAPIAPTPAEGAGKDGE